MTRRGFACIGLDSPMNPINVGAALRAAHCFGVSLVALSGDRYKRQSTDTTSAWRHIPLIAGADLHDMIPFDCVPVAVDLIEGARSLSEYTHPERAFYVFGAEDRTLGRAVLSWCRDVIYIPTSGCLNLAAAVNVVLYDRAAKRGEWPERLAKRVAPCRGGGRTMDDEKCTRCDGGGARTVHHGEGRRRWRRRWIWTRSRRGVRQSASESRAA